MSTPKPRRTTKNRPIYSLSALRALALHAQGLGTPPTASPTHERIFGVVDQLGCVQIDTLQMVHRSQYLCLFSRVGRYDPAHLDQVAFGTDGKGTDRQLFEYWLKEACLIPLKDYRYRLPLMRQFREGRNKWWETWAEKDENRALVGHVRTRIEAEGALRASDFEDKRHRGGSWWNWKPAKIALERLYNIGETMVTRREKFQRVYDLQERVLPTWVDTSEPTPEAMRRFLILRGARALGVCKPDHASDYLRVKRPEGRGIIRDLIETGELVTVQGSVMGGKEETLIVHRDNLPTLEAIAEGSLHAEHTTFLTPFDNLFWATRRDELFWGFTQTLECYKPAPQRRWGYFSLPILYRDALIGRFDPKLERKTKVLILRALHLEPDITITEPMIAAIAEAMRDFMAFHGAETLTIEASYPPAFGAALRTEMSDHSKESGGGKAKKTKKA